MTRSDAAAGAGRGAAGGGEYAGGEFGLPKIAVKLDADCADGGTGLVNTASCDPVGGGGGGGGGALAGERAGAFGVGAGAAAGGVGAFCGCPNALVKLAPATPDSEPRLLPNCGIGGGGAALE